MSRSKLNTKSHVSVGDSPLEEDRKNQLCALLSEFDKSQVGAFVATINGIIVAGYNLTPILATNGERKAWFAKVTKSIESLGNAIQNLTDDLAAADEQREKNEDGIQQWKSEDLAYLDRCLGPTNPQMDNSPSPLVEMLRTLKGACEEAQKSLGDKVKPKGKYQKIADELAYEWFLYLGKPTYSFSESEHGTSLFIKVLQFVLQETASYYGRLESFDGQKLRSIAKRAIEHAVARKKAERLALSRGT